MSRRYGERGFDDERNDEREYDAGTRGDETYGGGRRERDAGYGTPARGYSQGRDFDYGRDYGYGRDYSSGDYASRDYGQRDLERRDYGRRVLEEGGYSSRGREGEDYTAERGRDYRADYGRDRERDYGRERGRESERGIRSFDTDYGRTTSRFYGRSGYEFGREDYDRPNYGPEVTEYQGRHGGHEGRRHERDERDERNERDRGGRGWWDRAADEVLSWFGDDKAVRRRRMDGSAGGDERGREHGGAGLYRGRGPRNYRRSDERIREEINDRLTDNDWLDASDVEVTVASGEVTLSGTVDSRYSKRLAEDIAESVAGVTNVQNNLRVQNYQTGTPSAAPAGDAARDRALSPRDTLITSRDVTMTAGDPTLTDTRAGDDDDAPNTRATGAGGLG